MKKTKILFFLILAVLAAAVVGCGSGLDNSGSGGGNPGDGPNAEEIELGDVQERIIIYTASLRIESREITGITAFIEG